MKKLRVILLALILIPILSVNAYALTPAEEVRASPPNGNITIDKNGETVNIKIENKKKYGSLVITKIDADTKKPIAGVKFIVRDKSGKQVAEGVTNKNGIVKFNNLPLGDYTYEEVYAPKPY